MYQILGGDGREYGPVSTEQMRQWIAEGRLDATTKTRAQGEQDWKPLAQFPEFAAALAAGPVAQPAMPPVPPSIPPTAPVAHTGKPATSAMAITSLALGILGLFTCGLTALVGLILGIVSYGKIRSSQGRLTGSGVAVAGICVSAIFLLIVPVAILSGMLLPALAKAKEKAQVAVCVNNMKQLGLAARIYATDNGDQLPRTAKWCDALSSEVSPPVFQCRADPGRRSSYAMNQALNGKKVDEVNPLTVLFFESNAGWNGTGGASSIVSHNHRRNREDLFVVGLVNGSVLTLTRSEVNALRWDP